jgi:drug/metabolite transporter (DMT)-like permease
MTAKGGATPSPGGATGTGRFFTVGLVTAWYSSNIGVLLLNKYLLSNYGFKYPIFLTMCHMSACALLSYAAIAWLRVVPMQLVRSRLQLAKIAALSLVFCGSVVSGNISLRYLPVSFNQAVGATTPFFTAVFAYLMTVKRESWITYLTLVPVVTGVVIASGVSYCLFRPRYLVSVDLLEFGLDLRGIQDWLPLNSSSGIELTRRGGSL